MSLLLGETGQLEAYWRRQLGLVGLSSTWVHLQLFNCS
jgi:hypothetical protein